MCTITKSQIELGGAVDVHEKAPNSPCRLVILFPPRLGEKNKNKRDLIINLPHPRFPLRYLNCPAGSYRPFCPTNHEHDYNHPNLNLQGKIPTSGIASIKHGLQTYCDSESTFLNCSIRTRAIRSIYIRWFLTPFYCVSLRFSITGWQFFLTSRGTYETLPPGNDAILARERGLSV